ncbi:MAG: hypothetical protein GY913_17225 [Proteobacteria bacterium]|nr:hypothetical protein [Pseudomonadota bacterium]MCP4918648.1 hypothetical protein [Pseudomonadota bacterium]
MSRAIYESLSDPNTAADHGAEAVLLAHFAQAAADLRAWMPDSLAESEFREGLHAEEDDEAVEQDEARLAADTDARVLPAEYRGGPWRVRIGISAIGEVYVELLEGPGPLSVLGVVVQPGLRVPLFSLEAPQELVVVDENGQEWMLS